MTFHDGDTTEHLCPKCEAKDEENFLVMEMSFQDAWRDGANEGHYTIDCPILFCPKCDYTRDYDEGDYDDE